MKTRLRLRAAVVLTVTVAGLLLARARVSRANAPAGRYATSGGSVYDTKTKLTWQQTASSGTYTWGSATTPGTAQNQCGALDGGSWRVPTVGELLTLVDRSQPPSGPPCTAPMIDPTAFPAAACDVPYWTSTPVARSSSQLVWFVGFSDGNVNNDAPTAAYHVRCVH